MTAAVADRAGAEPLGDGVKTCTGCGEAKALEEFGPDRRNRDGRKARCRECDAERSRRRYAENVEEIRERRSRHYRANAAAIRERHARHRATLMDRSDDEIEAARAEC
jgi:hypothetical protein